MRRSATFDMPLFFTILLLVGLGIALIYTASYPKAMAMVDAGDTDFFGGFYFAGRQIMFALIGLVCLFICAAMPLRALRRATFWIIIVTVGVLITVLLIGSALHGNKAWIRLGPLGQFQPSEFARVTAVLAMAAYLAQRPWTTRSLKGLWSGPIWYLLVPVGLIMLQGDMGTGLAFFGALVTLLAMAGVKFRYWGLPLLGIGLVIALAVSAMMASGHGGKIARFRAWMNPFDQTIQASYQPRQSLIAVGSGGLLGRGFCQSRQKWFYLPGAQNDYIFAIVNEELGLVGAIVFLGLYFILIYRGLSIAHRAPDEYSALVAAGATMMLATSAIINMAVVLNLVPCIGINLPFISYGGSSIIGSMMLAGLLLNVSMATGKEARAQQADAQDAPPARSTGARRSPHRGVPRHV